MKKIVSLLICLSFVLFCFCSCAETVDYSDKVIDVNALASELNTKLTFVDDLALVDESIVSALYGFKGTEKLVVYAAGGATPEEIIVAEYATVDDAIAAFSAFEARVTSQEKIFDTYNPEYRPLLNGMYLKQLGKYVVYCVSSSNADIAGIVDAAFNV